MLHMGSYGREERMFASFTLGLHGSEGLYSSLRRMHGSELEFPHSHRLRLTCRIGCTRDPSLKNTARKQSFSKISVTFLVGCFFYLCFINNTDIGVAKIINMDINERRVCLSLRIYQGRQSIFMCVISIIESLVIYISWFFHN